MTSGGIAHAQEATPSSSSTCATKAEAEAAIDEIVAADGTAFAVRADITGEVDVERLFSETKAAFGVVDAVVHTVMRGASVVNQEAARQLRHGGAIVNGADHDVADLIALLDQSRGSPGN